MNEEGWKLEREEEEQQEENQEETKKHLKSGLLAEKKNKTLWNCTIWPFWAVLKRTPPFKK